MRFITTLALLLASYAAAKAQSSDWPQPTVRDALNYLYYRINTVDSDILRPAPWVGGPYGVIGTNWTSIFVYPLSSFSNDIGFVTNVYTDEQAVEAAESAGYLKTEPAFTNWLATTPPLYEYVETDTLANSNLVAHANSVTAHAASSITSTGAHSTVQEYVASAYSVATGALSAAQQAYPAGNPSNYIGLAAATGVAERVIGVYTGSIASAYPSSNPSNFITAADVPAEQYTGTVSSVSLNGVTNHPDATGLLDLGEVSGISSVEATSIAEGVMNARTNDIAKGVTAFSWGDHAQRGYLTNETTFLQWLLDTPPLYSYTESDTNALAVIAAHTGNTSNPHSTTAAQVGAVDTNSAEYLNLVTNTATKAQGALADGALQRSGGTVTGEITMYDEIPLIFGLDRDARIEFLSPYLTFKANDPGSGLGGMMFMNFVEYLFYGPVVANSLSTSNMILGGVSRTNWPSLTSPDREPYVIPASTNMIVDRGNTDSQRIASIPGGASTIRFAAAVTNYASAIVLHVPPVGTNTVTLAAGPVFSFGGGLSALATTNYSTCFAESPVGSTNWAVTIWPGVAQ